MRESIKYKREPRPPIGEESQIMLIKYMRESIKYKSIKYRGAESDRA